MLFGEFGILCYAQWVVFSKWWLQWQPLWPFPVVGYCLFVPGH